MTDVCGATSNLHLADLRIGGLTQIGPRGGIPPLDISGCLSTLVSLRHVIWISHSNASFGKAIRHKIYGIQRSFFQKLGFENA